MKKHLLSWATLLVGVATLFSCSDDEPSGPKYYQQTYSNGAVVVCAGNQHDAIDGSLTMIDYANNKAVGNYFEAANGRKLGLTANDGLVYGSKMYVVVDKENTLEVIDLKTQKSTQVKLTELMGTDKGVSPRHIISGAGCVWLTTYGTSKGGGHGYVAQIDTTNLKLKKNYDVGSYPEGLLGIGTDIYVANSDYGNGKGTISRVNLNSGTTTTYSIEGIENPKYVYYGTDGRFYVLDAGLYLKKEGSWTQENAGLKVLTAGKKSGMVIENATDATLLNGNFYFMKNPYGSKTPASYGIYSLSSYTTTPLSLKADAPCFIGVDPVTKHIFLGSYSLGETGYPSYKINGYVQEYNADGSSMLHRYETGVGPTTIFFNAGVKYVKVK